MLPCCGRWTGGNFLLCTHREPVKERSEFELLNDTHQTLIKQDDISTKLRLEPGPRRSLQKSINSMMLLVLHFAHGLHTSVHKLICHP